jgi:hypothetical protein
MSELRIVPCIEVETEELFLRLARLTTMIERESTSFEQATLRMEDLVISLTGWAQAVYERMVRLEHEHVAFRPPRPAPLPESGDSSDIPS